MKKVFAIFVSLIMLFSFAACEVDDSEGNKTETKKSDVVGEYTCEAMEVESKIYDPADFGYEMVMVLEEGGKGEVRDQEEKYEVEWKLDGDTITIKDQETDLSGKIKNGVMEIEQPEGSMWFVKEGASLPKEVKDNIVDEDEHYGSYYEDEIDYDSLPSDETYDYYEDDETYSGFDIDLGEIRDLEEFDASDYITIIE